MSTGSGVFLKERSLNGSLGASRMGKTMNTESSPKKARRKAAQDPGTFFLSEWPLRFLSRGLFALAEGGRARRLNNELCTKE